MTHETWPPDYIQVEAWRRRQLARFEQDPKYLKSAIAFYSRPENCVHFINHWCSTYDPRRLAKRKLAKIPFILFKRQAELVEFVLACLDKEAPGLTEKCRDAGVTWVCCAISVWLWLFYEGSAIGWGSRKQELVDRLGDPSSIFEKLRIIINNLPECFLPEDFSAATNLHFMRIVNPSNGSTIIGEIGDDIGRGGRTLIYFLDESSHYARPEKIEAAISENTRVPIDISSVNSPNNVFYRKRDNGIDWQLGQDVDPYRTNVFVFDWSDHPEKTPEWHAARKAKATLDGLYHIFAQEVERNYFAAVEGTIIKPEWFDACLDAHIKLKIKPTGARMGALDVADGGLDDNALSIRTGILLQYLKEWGGRDTGQTARLALDTCKDWLVQGPTVKDESGSDVITYLEFLLWYDCIGVGAGVKAESNRLIADNPELLKSVSFLPWNAAAAVQDKFDYVIPDDDKSPKNGDMFGNFKAQAWWNFARRMERTYKAVTEKGFTFDEDEIISIPSTLPLKDKLKKELCQPTASKNSHLKMIIDKTPEGTRSPNLADCVVMNFFPPKERPDPNLGVGGITVISNAQLGSLQRM